MARYEIARVLRGLRTRWLLCGLFAMMAVPVVVNIARGGAEHPGAAESRARAASLIRFYGMEGARALFGCPSVILSLGLATLFLLPLVTLVLTYDSVADGVESHTARLLVIRASRGTLIVGTAIACWTTFCAVLLAGYAVVTVAEIASGAAGQAVVLRCSAMFYLSACVIAAAYVSTWVLVSSIARTRREALWVCVGVGFLFAVVRGLLHERLPALEPFVPGGLDRLLMSGKASLRWEALGVAAAWCGVTLVTAARALERRDI